MKAKELIELLQRVDGDTQIAVCCKSGLTKIITLWDWSYTSDVVVLVGIDKLELTDIILPTEN